MLTKTPKKTDLASAVVRKRKKVTPYGYVQVRNPLYGTEDGTVQVFLNHPAFPHDVVVELTCSDVNHLSVPATITVPHGERDSGILPIYPHNIGPDEVYDVVIGGSFDGHSLESAELYLYALPAHPVGSVAFTTPVRTLHTSTANTITLFVPTPTNVTFTKTAGPACSINGQSLVGANVVVACPGPTTNFNVTAGNTTGDVFLTATLPNGDTVLGPNAFAFSIVLG